MAVVMAAGLVTVSPAAALATEDIVGGTTDTVESTVGDVSNQVQDTTDAVTDPLTGGDSGSGSGSGGTDATSGGATDSGTGHPSSGGSTDAATGHASSGGSSTAGSGTIAPEGTSATGGGGTHATDGTTTPSTRDSDSSGTVTSGTESGGSLPETEPRTGGPSNGSTDSHRPGSVASRGDSTDRSQDPPGDAAAPAGPGDDAISAPGRSAQGGDGRVEAAPGTSAEAGDEARGALDAALLAAGVLVLAGALWLAGWKARAIRRPGLLRSRSRTSSGVWLPAAKDEPKGHR